MVDNLSNSTLNALLKDYEQKKYNIELNFEKAKSSFYKSHPELEEIENTLGKLAIEISKAILIGNIDMENSLRIKFDELKKQKNNLLKSIKIPKRCNFSII